MKINGIKLNVPLKTKIAVRKAKKDLEKAGNKNIVAYTNKRGDVALFAYNNAEHDEPVVSQIIHPDGTETLNLYKKFPLWGTGNQYVKMIETWDKKNNNLLFNKQVTMQYSKASKVPEVVTTMYSDANLDDGVKIVKRYPFSIYAKNYQRPQK